MICKHNVLKQDSSKKGEQKTLWVIVITLVMMVAEISYGMLYGSMGLLADGMHMGTHAFALSITFFAYIFARKQRKNSNFAFGTGKVSSLAGFTSALFLMSTAVIMFKEAFERLFNPVEIGFNESILVAIIGLLVNVVSMLLLGDNHDHGHDHGHNHTHDHKCDHTHDHNLKAAYLHVLADALTSFTAIFALLAGKYLGAVWLDPVVAIVGGILVLRWAVGLLKESGKILLDYQGDSRLREQVIGLFEDTGAQVTDLHLWQIDANSKGVIVSVRGGNTPTVNGARSIMKEQLKIDHVTIECM